MASHAALDGRGGETIQVASERRQKGNVAPVASMLLAQSMSRAASSASCFKVGSNHQSAIRG